MKPKRLYQVTKESVFVLKLSKRYTEPAFKSVEHLNRWLNKLGNPFKVIIFKDNFRNVEYLQEMPHEQLEEIRDTINEVLNETIEDDISLSIEEFEDVGKVLNKQINKQVESQKSALDKALEKEAKWRPWEKD